VHPSLTPPPADALLFDWDGTLVDSQDANYRAMSHALSITGIHLDKEWFGSRTGISSAEMIELLARELGVTLPVPVGDLVGRRDARFLAEATSIRPHAAVLEVVQAAHGGTPMAIASGGSRQIILGTLRHLPFRDSFDAVVTRDDVERGKPAPDIFLNAAAALNADPARCVVYEDSDEGISAACAAGMRVIDVRPYTGRGTTGSRGTSTPAEAEAGLLGH
jgi:HAD superfamily hydrolase (TIGR01509 family)